MGILLLQCCIFDQKFFAFCRKHVDVGKKMFYNSDVIGSIKQKCIPVGCVPPASVAVSGEGGLSARGCLPGGGSAHGVSALGGCLPWGVPVRGGVCPGGVCPGGVCPRGGVCHTRPPTCGQTDACENITLLETSFASGKYLPNRSGKCFYLMMTNRNNPARSRKAESDPTVRFLRFTGILYRQWTLPLLPEVMFGTVTDLMYLRQHTGLLKAGMLFTLFNKIDLSLL